MKSLEDMRDISEILTVMPGRWSNGHGAAPGSIPYHGHTSGPRKRDKRVKNKNYKLTSTPPFSLRD